MSSIFILKEILDLLYEESKRGELVTTDIENRLRHMEKQLEEKNKELSRLYTENIRLENTLRKYESEFELLSNMPIIPVENSVESEKKEKESESKESKNQESVKTEKEKDSEEERKQLSEAQPLVKDISLAKQKRREYLTEYQRKYRKAKREHKMEMKV